MMKKYIITLLFVAFSSAQYFSQINFEKGYIITNDNKKVSCFIKNEDWLKNPTTIEYKLTSSSEIKTATLKNITEFSIEGTSKYIKRRVDIDKSSDSKDVFNTDRNPKYYKEDLFLKVLLESDMSLYQYTNTEINRFFL